LTAAHTAPSSSFSRVSSGILAGPSSATTTFLSAFHLYNDSRRCYATATVNAKEAAKFAKVASHWWDPSGPFRPLHQMNPTRCRFIRSALCDAFELEPSVATPLAGLRVLDVGCGGGLLSEALARMGADVTGIDVTEEAVAAARAHASLDPALSSSLRYEKAALEELVAQGEKFDAVIASEVIEHVDNVEGFCRALSAATVPRGAVVVSTMSRTARAFALAVVAAEHVLRMVPAGEHFCFSVLCILLAFLQPRSFVFFQSAGDDGS
jgi:polyprenyldihydroxybenzoate methyltransferase / 3-demethylubiquinol 3-O-methyltransferase